MTLLLPPPALHSHKLSRGRFFFTFFIFFTFSQKIAIFHQDQILEEAVLHYARDNLALVKVLNPNTNNGRIMYFRIDFSKFDKTPPGP